MSYDIEKSQAVMRAGSLLERAVTKSREFLLDDAANEIYDAASAALKLLDPFVVPPDALNLMDAELDEPVVFHDEIDGFIGGPWNSSALDD